MHFCSHGQTQETEPDPVEEMLAEIEAAAESAELGGSDEGGSASEEALMLREGDAHRVQLPDGGSFIGTWRDLVLQIFDARAQPGENIAQFMQRHAAEAHAR